MNTIISSLSDEAIGRRLAQARKHAGYTKREFAVALGISESGYTPYEKGKHGFTVQDLSRIAGILYVPVESLLGLTTPFSEKTTVLVRIYDALEDPKLQELVFQAAVNASEVSRKG